MKHPGTIVSTALPALLLATTFIPATSKNHIRWETLGNFVDADSTVKHTQRFTLDTDRPFSRFAFCFFKTNFKPLNPIDTVIELLPGYYAVGSPRFAQTDGKMPIVVDIVADGAITHESWKAEGIHFVVDGKAIPTEYEIIPATQFAGQWQVPGKNGYDPMIYGPEAYAINDSLRSDKRPAPYAQIPTPKNIKLKEQKFPVPVSISLISGVNDTREEYYKVEITPDRILLRTNSKHPAAMVKNVMRRIRKSADENGMVYEGVIEDWADYPYRGFMLDVARNFTNKEDVKKIIDIMADYGLNILHFHVGDDEGWRVELPSLTELTEVGSRRGYAVSDDVPYLKQIYSGDGDPESEASVSNGFYTVDDYIDILRHADERGVSVIPEFDSPGHSRAAILAMEHRYRTTGDAALRLIHDGDTSKYTTAQFFDDNLMNPALDGPYKFWGLVFDDLKDIYNKAGVELKAIHIGGDEVPAHAWDGSEPVRRLMQREGYKEQRDVHAHFVRRVVEEAKKRGIRISGWQEVALDHPEDYDNAVRDYVYSVNCWTTADGNAAKIAAEGYPLVLSNVNYLYFDHIHTHQPGEPGMSWGGIVSEFSPLHATIDELCQTDASVQRNVVGVSGHLFAETVRNTPMIERYILPRLLGLAERAHNSHATLSDGEYFGALTQEMTRWKDAGYTFYLRQPGILVHGDNVEMNEPYGFGEIRYTLDGSEPIRTSALYTSPIPVSSLDTSQIRARLFYGNSASTVSILDLRK